jgi:L-iditol 2-dehydrogenase
MQEFKTMKFGCLVKKGQAEVHERPLPEMKDNEVIVKHKACNICTTDYGQWLGLREHQGYPMAGGHEGSGIVVAKGANVTNVEIGDFVAHTYEGCGTCPACVVGDVMNCINGEGMRKVTEDGYRGMFGFSTYAIANSKGLLKMNKDLDPSEAGFLEPVSTVVHGIERLRVRPVDNVVVIGAGTMGLVNAQVARVFGGRVIVSEIMENKLETARKMGFQVIDAGKEDVVARVKELTDGEGADAVIVAVGNTKANQQALDLLKKSGGRVLLFAAGYPAPELVGDSNLVHYRRIEYIGTFGASMKDFILASKLLNTHAIDVSPLVDSVKFKLEDIQKAFETAATPGKYRVSVLLDE